MPPIRQMNGVPVRYAAVTDFGKPERRTVWSAHTSIGAARRSIFTATRAHAAGSHAGIPWRFWVAEIDPTEAREYEEVEILAYLPEGPYDRDHRPDAATRKAP
jgi:hypothetical protein